MEVLKNIYTSRKMKYVIKLDCFRPNYCGGIHKFLVLWVMALQIVDPKKKANWEIREHRKLPHQ